jgi:GT2 family glycosyltransferase
VPRPSVDVVVPFRGSDAERRDVVARMRTLALGEDDTLTVVDNGPLPPPCLGDDPVVIHAPSPATSYHARNAGAQRGSADWILFLDADVVAPIDLLDRCFGEPLPERAGVVAGGVRDEAPEDADALPLAARYAAKRAPMAQDNTLRHARPYAQTANAAFRRTAFEAAGGFEDRVRSGGDADLCWRLAALGWELVSRPEAAVVHRNRTTLRALLRQRVRHGAGAAWLNRLHPGSLPARETCVFVAHKLVELLRETARLNGEAAALTGVDVLAGCAFLLGRAFRNEPGAP